MMQINLNRVDAVAGVAAEEQNSATTNRAAAQSAEPQDTATLSGNSLAVPSLAAQALSTAETRAAKVEALRQAVANAAYVVDPALVADAIISAGIEPL